MTIRPSTIVSLILFAAAGGLAGCANPNGADVERFDQEGSNEQSPSSWSSDEVQLTDRDRVVVLRGGEPNVVVALETCGRPIVDGGTIDLGIEDADGCAARVIYSEMVHDCDSCEGLRDGIVGDTLNGLFVPEHRWGSVSGNAVINLDAEAADIVIEADMRPLSISLGENTAEGRFRLRSHIFMADFEP